MKLPASGPILLALDVGGTKTMVAAVAGLPQGRLRPLRPAVRFATPRDTEAFLEQVIRAAAQALPDGSRPDAVGIGVPGPLDTARGLVPTSTNIGWRDFPIVARVSELFGDIPVSIDDDANTGALGEAIVGSGRGADPFVYLPLGTGLGSGVVVGGQVMSGAHGAAGEVGHLAAGDRDGPRCGCGRRNCLETWCAGAGLARRARETWPARQLPDGTTAPRDAAGVFALARGGDPDALALVVRGRHALALGMAALMASLDPTAMSVGGTIGVAEPSWVREAFDEARRLVHPTAARGVRLVRPRLGDASVLGGAAVLAARAAGVKDR